jgi:hypothetical protein
MTFSEIAGSSFPLPTPENCGQETSVSPTELFELWHERRLSASVLLAESHKVLEHKFLFRREVCPATLQAAATLVNLETATKRLSL